MRLSPAQCTHLNSPPSIRTIGIEPRCVCGLVLRLRILMLRPFLRPPIGLVGGVAVLLLELAYKTILLAPDFLKLVVGEFAPLFPRFPFEFLPLALDDIPVHLAHPPASCLLYTSPSPRDGLLSRMPSSA